MPGPSLGTNMAGLVDWSTAFPFLDLFRMSRDWFTQTDGQFNSGQAGLLDLDENGWIRGFTQDGSPAPFDRVATILFTGGHLPGGTYVLDWQGEGTIELAHVPAEAVVERGDHHMVLRLSPGQVLQIALTATDPDGTGDYLRDIRLYNTQHAELLAAGQQFTPEFLDRIDGFRVLRFMDWMGTNNSTVSTWEDATHAGAARETVPGGAAVETMVDLANTVRADPWFNIPHLATDDYIRQLATYVRDHLDPGLVARFELSNEVWNWGFGQAQHAQAQAEALWGSDVEGGWMQWYGMRAAQMAGIVADVFGAETGSRALNVIATQSGWWGLEDYALNAPDWVAGGGAPPRDAPFHVYAIASYFGGSMGSAEMSDQVDAWIAEGEDGFGHAIAWLRSTAAPDTLGSIGATIAYHAGVAASLGWQLEGYEGGQHIVDLDGLFGGAQSEAQTEFFTALVRQPAFRDLYLEYFAIWRDNGGGLMAQFSDFGEGGRYGSWGIWDSIYSPDTPRALAVQEFRDGVAAWWDDGREAGVFANGTVWVDRDGKDSHAGTALDDVLSGLRGDNSLSGGGGDDLIFARWGNDRLAGGAGNDALSAGRGDDTLSGDAGDDVLTAGSGNDRLTGGAGRDVLSGGAGDDVFVFAALTDSSAAHADQIARFRPGHDRIDLSGITQGTAPLWLGQTGFSASGAAELRRVGEDGAQMQRIELDLDGDGTADLAIDIGSTARINLTDFLF